jgi:hypothetical protein
MRRMEWTHYGFHGTTKIRIIVSDSTQPGQTVQVSEAVARRLNKAVCGISGCECGEIVAAQGWDERNPDDWYVKTCRSTSPK